MSHATAPHIGHLHSLVLTDVLARYAKLRNPDREVIFTTGTDEHGLKIQQAAKAQGIEEEAFCAGVSQRFRVCVLLNPGVALSSPESSRQGEYRIHGFHKNFRREALSSCHAFLGGSIFAREDSPDVQNKLVDSGDLYKGTHSGWYSISDECFYSQTQVEKDPKSDKMIAIETGNEVIWEQEENWKFRLDKFRPPLLEWVRKTECALNFGIQEQARHELTSSRFAGKYERIRRFSHGDCRGAVSVTTEEQSQVGCARTWRCRSNDIRLGRRTDKLSDGPGVP